jgi:hypothetical protein
MDLKEMGWVAMDWTTLAQGRDTRWAVVNMVMNIQGSKSCGIS